jgi:hypothetical protein
MGGSRQLTFEKFQDARRDNTTALNLLLVDSEGPVSSSPWDHLKNQDGWDRMGAQEDQCYLMVPCMEAWFLADIEALSSFFGQGFQRKAIPKPEKIESLDKAKVMVSLKKAIHDTNKPAYQKILHANGILKRLVPERVRRSAKQCHRLFLKLEELAL